MPRRNAFRFATVLRVRERQEQLRAQSLAEVRRQIRRTLTEREQIALEQAQALDEAGRATREEFHGPDIHAYFQYERHLARVSIEKDATLQKLRKVEGERRAALNEATKRKRMIERLKERFLRARHTEWRKTEQKLSDEIAGIRAAMEMQNGRES
jgi:flagellar FliJ protein